MTFPLHRNADRQRLYGRNVTMLRVVGLQRDENPSNEFVLLQNQGHMRIILRGHLLLSESALCGRSIDESAFAILDDESIAPGLFVLISTGCGVPNWSRTKDGAYVYRTFMNRSESLWTHCKCPIHLMAPQHSYSERRAPIEAAANR